MPEIAEGKSLRATLSFSIGDIINLLLLVARCVHFLRQHLVGKRIAKIQAVDDNNVFGKVGTSGSAFEKALKGRTVSGSTTMPSIQIRY